MKLRILLINDEPFMHRYLKTLLKNSGVRFELAGDAYDGEQGLGLCLSQHPDLIFCDIKMPVMDGLEFCSAVRERRIPCRIILLTAYRDFEYAKRAVSLNVSYYLLKPVSSADFNRLMSDILKQFTAEFDDRFSRQLYNALYNQESLPEYSALLQEYSSFYLLSVYYGSVSSGYTALDAALPKQQFESWLHHWNEPVHFWTLSPLPSNITVVLLASPEEISQRLCTELKAYVHELDDSDIPVNICLSALSCSLSDLQDLFLSQKKELLKNSIFGQSQISVNGSALFPVENQINEFAPALQHLFSAVPQENFHIFADCLSSLLNTLRAHNAGQLVLTKILKNLIYEILSLHGLSRDLYLLDFELLLEDLISTHCSYSSLEEELKPFYRELYEFSVSLRASMTANSSLPVLIKNYLEEHYSEAISLKDIAQRFHISYSHACRIYKQAHGISLTDALTSIRIAHACELLRSSLPISEIASKTGYHDPYYFSRVFKQETGYSPKRYREMHLSSSFSANI